MNKFASETEVPAEKSRSEIERTLARYGATSFLYGWAEERAIVGFTIQGRQIKFLLPMPNREDADIRKTPTGNQRNAANIESAYEQAVRQRWRALALVIKAKLEAATSGIATIEEEFLAHIVLPDGQTVGQFMKPQIETAYQSREMPKLLTGY